MYDSPHYPVGPEDRDWIESRMAWLIGEFGRDRVLSRPVVLPTADYFPDPYDGSPDAVRVLLDRVCGYLEIPPATVEVELYEDDHPPYLTEGLREGTAGLYEEDDGVYRIWLESANLDDPLALVATMAHELGHVLLLGHRRVSASDPDHEPLTDLLTVVFGLGVITANSVIRERSWSDGQASGWSVGRQGYLTMPKFGYALAVYARERNEVAPSWVRTLRPDVRKAFEQSRRVHAECWNAGQPKRDIAPWRPARAGDSSPLPPPEPAPSASEAYEVARCVYCGSALPTDDEAGMTCDECRASMEANDRAVQAAAAKAEIDYRERSRVAWTTCVVLAVGLIVLVVWQIVRALLG